MFVILLIVQDLALFECTRWLAVHRQKCAGLPPANLPHLPKLFCAHQQVVKEGWGQRIMALSSVSGELSTGFCWVHTVPSTQASSPCCTLRRLGTIPARPLTRTLFSLCCKLHPGMVYGVWTLIGAISHQLPVRSKELHGCGLWRSLRVGAERHRS